MRIGSAQSLLLVAFVIGCVSAPGGARDSGPVAPATATSADPLPANGDPAPREMRIATDSSYGYTQANPIKVGGAKAQQGAQNERAFLDALRGPNGEPVRYERHGSCCQFKTPNAMIFDIGSLDVYSVTYDGATKPRTLYINMYDYEPPRAPVGFTRAR